MQVGSKLEFQCLECNDTVSFSLLSNQSPLNIISCKGCEKKYSFADTSLLEQLEKFERLCTHIQTCKDILGDTHVAVTVGPHEVKIPFKILLTRMNSLLNLEIGGKKIEIKFRIEPIREVEKVLSSMS